MQAHRYSARDVELTSGFLIYAALYHVAVIAAGVVSIVLGYRLFVRGVMPGDGTDAHASAGDIKLTLKNASPGTVFALFGAVIIGATVTVGRPELAMQRLDELDEQTGARTQTLSTRVRGTDSLGFVESSRGFDKLVREGRERRRAGDVEGAIEAYASALSNSTVTLAQAARPVNELARIYVDEDRIEEALTLARLAYQIDPLNPAYLETLARVNLRHGSYGEAVEASRLAVELSPEGNDKAGRLHTLALSLEATGEVDAALQTLSEAVELNPSYTVELEAMRKRRL